MLKHRTQSRDEGLWALSTAHQLGIGDVVARLKEATAPGHGEARFVLGDFFYDLVRGVKKSDKDAVRWNQKAVSEGGASA